MEKNGTLTKESRLTETDFQKIMNELVEYFFKRGENHGE